MPILITRPAHGLSVIYRKQGLDMIFFVVPSVYCPGISILVLFQQVKKLLLTSIHESQLSCTVHD
jgi:hypothetical protein